MLYSFALTIPANTPATAPEELEVELVPGIIHRVEVQFPFGVLAFAHVQVLRGVHQAWPSNPDADLASEGAIIGWDEHYELPVGETILTLRGWNLDDTWDHTITFRFAVFEETRGGPVGPAGLLGRIADFLGVR